MCRLDLLCSWIQGTYLRLSPPPHLSAAAHPQYSSIGVARQGQPCLLESPGCAGSPHHAGRATFGEPVCVTCMRGLFTSLCLRVPGWVRGRHAKHEVKRGVRKQQCKLVPLTTGPLNFACRTASGCKFLAPQSLRAWHSARMAALALLAILML